MKTSDILPRRLRSQRVVGPGARKFESAREAVHWMGAVQSQDYLAAKWAVGQRMKACTDAAFDEAFSRGDILRTHVLRPTWHFVSPADLRWMLALTAPRVNALRAYYNRQHGLDEAVFARSRAVIAKALEGGAHRTRDELGDILATAKIGGGPERRGNILLDAELEGLVCSGPLRGKHHTYALVEARAPEAARAPSRDEALAELARRFFVSHGPATLKDYVWWSGLTVADARAGVENVTPRLAREVVGDRTCSLFTSGLPAAGVTRNPVPSTAFSGKAWKVWPSVSPPPSAPPSPESAAEEDVEEEMPPQPISATSVGKAIESPGVGGTKC